MDTEPFACHIEGLAYSQENKPPPLVEYQPEKRRRYEWVTAAAALVAAATVMTWTQWDKPSATTTETTQTEQPTLEPPLTFIPPPTDHQTPAPTAQHIDSPDTVFAAGWNDQMPRYPFSDEFCKANGASSGCWLQLRNTNPNDIEFLFVGRSRCEYIREHPGPDAAQQAARDIRIAYHDVTIAQSREMVTLAIRAYCPDQREK